MNHAPADHALINANLLLIDQMLAQMVDTLDIIHEAVPASVNVAPLVGATSLTRNARRALQGFRAELLAYAPHAAINSLNRPDCENGNLHQYRQTPASYLVGDELRRAKPQADLSDAAASPLPHPRDLYDLLNPAQAGIDLPEL